MKTFRIATALFSLTAAAVVWAAVEEGTPIRSPVVVELFQSQGCSDCPPAQENLNRLSDRDDVLALSYGVTYWDYLGWKDSFASPQFTQRQREYSARNHGIGVATPQYWINGRETVLGANPARVAQLIASSGPLGGPTIFVRGSVLSIGSGSAPSSGADIWLVFYDPRAVPVAIRAGENGGRTVLHRDIVRELKLLGRWSGEAETVSLPLTPEGLKGAVLIQIPSGGAILAVTRI